MSGWLLGEVIGDLGLTDADEVSRRSSRWALWFFIMSFADFICCVLEVRQSTLAMCFQLTPWSSQGWLLEFGVAAYIVRRLRREGAEAVINQEVGYLEGQENGAGGLTSGGLIRSSPA